MCYCNLEGTYETCCEPVILGKTMAQTAEQLMRSRYSAFVVANINHLMNSHHPHTRPTKERKQILKWTKSIDWIRLEVLATTKGQLGDATGTVEFKAFYKENDSLECIHENSLFEFVNGQWFYKSGTHN